MWLFASGFSHSAWCFQGPYVLQHTSVCVPFHGQINSSVCICRILFNHSFVEGRLDCFYVWLSWIVLLWTLCTSARYNICFQFGGGYVLLSGFAGSYGNLCLAYWGTAKIFLKLLHNFTFPPEIGGFQLLHIFVTHVLFYFVLSIAILRIVKWRLPSASIYSSLVMNGTQHLVMSCGHLCIFFGEMSIQVISHFLLACLVSCCWAVRVLYIF